MSCSSRSRDRAERLRGRVVFGGGEAGCVAALCLGCEGPGRVVGLPREAVALRVVTTRPAGRPRLRGAGALLGMPAEAINLKH